MFELHYPWLLVLLPLPLLIYRFVPRANVAEGAALYVPYFHQVQKLMAQEPAGKMVSDLPRKIRLGLLTLTWLLLVAAATGPTWVGEPVGVPSSGRDLMMAVDLSGSMEIEDMVIVGRRVNRLTATQVVMDDFIKRRQGDRLGLILFGSQAYLQAPLTFDRQTVGQLMLEAGIGMAGNQTAIGDAVGLAVKQLRERPADKRVLILLTDGANTAGAISPKQAAEIAKKEGIKIYTIGLGATEMTERTFLGSRTVNPSQDLDEETLKAMAEGTGGQFFRATNPEELNEIYSILDKLEPTEQQAQTFRPKQNLFYWPLGLAVMLSLLLAVTHRWGREAW